LPDNVRIIYAGEEAMPNKLATIFSFVFLVISLAYAASSEQPNSVILGPTNNTKSQADLQQNKEAAEQTAKKVIPLDKGIYSIPFNATIDEILIWCKDNNMTIADDNEQDSLKHINDRASQIMGHITTYQADKQSLQTLEEELLKIKKNNDPASAYIENARIDALLNKLEIFKNLCFSYAGEKYYLNSLFSNGIEMRLDGRTRFCTNPEITKTSYKLILIPTKDSIRMRNNGIKELHISFYGDINQAPKTYATFALCGASVEKRVGAQYEYIMETLKEKYGSPICLPMEASDKELHTDAYDALFNVIYLSIGRNLSRNFDNTYFIWDRGIFLMGKISYYRDNTTSFTGSEFGILYYNPNAVKWIDEHHKKAIENYENEYNNQRKQESKQRKDDF
jgi:hypothetical protein